MSGGKVKDNQVVRAGGNFYVTGGGDSGQSVTLSGSAKITGGLADSSSTSYDALGGAVWLEGAGSSLEMSGGEISGNKAKSSDGKNACAGIYVSGATFTMSGGKISGNNVLGGNSQGGAVRLNGKFNISGSAYIPYGNAIGNNDVFLAQSTSGTPAVTTYAKINIANDITTTGTVATITPQKYKRGMPILSGTSTLLSSHQSKFQLSDGNNADWDRSSTAVSTEVSNIIIASPVYVAGASATRVSGVDYGKGLATTEGGLGTKSKPFKFISDAVAVFEDASSPAVVTIVGTTYPVAQEIPDTFTTTSNASALTLKGLSSSSIGTIKRFTNPSSETASDTGSALKVNSTVPVTIQDITITGGKTSGNGGGILVNGVKGASLTLSTGANVTANTASSNGGGVYFAGTAASGGTANLIMNDTAQIGGNTASGESSNGGGVYLKYANLCMSGSALIGDTSGTKAAASNLKSNMAYKGGGVYCDTGAKVYLGCNSSGAETTGSGANLVSYKLGNTYGIRHNFASSCGGGIYVNSGSVTFKSGYIFANGTAATDGCDGGGIWQNSGTTVTMSGGAIAKNRGKFGGGVYAGGAFTLSGGDIGDSSKETPADGGSTGTYSNSATYGGGIYAPLGSTLTLNGGYVSYNYGSSDGGGIWAKGTATFKANCNYNIAGLNGGGILSSTINLTGGTIKGNKSSKGGGLYVVDGTVSMADATISDNEASYGGGVYVGSGTFTMESGAVGDSGNKDAAADSASDKHSNSATTQGGGIYVLAGTANLNGGVVGYNYCAAGAGGGIYYKSGTLTVKNKVQYNSSFSGGGVSVQDNYCTLDGATFIKNVASSTGGAAWVNNGKTLNVKGSLSMLSPAINSNDIFLVYASSKYGQLNVSDALAGSGAVAMLTLSSTSYTAGVTVVKKSGSTATADESKWFAVAPNGTTQWSLNASGQLTKGITATGATAFISTLPEGSLTESSALQIKVDSTDDVVAIGEALRTVTPKRWVKVSFLSTSITELPDDTFRSCRITEITLPNSITKLGANCFQSNKFASITLPSSLTTIGYDCFYWADKLTSITIPASVTSISASCFIDTESLQSITVESGNAYYKDINGVLYNKSGTILVRYPTAKAGTSYVIPDGVTKINNGAFWSEKTCKLTTITIPASINTSDAIAYRAFTQVMGLTKIIYKGTKAQWAVVNSNHISRDIWGNIPGPVTVSCTDGNVQLEMD